jgi:hypothetical protein
MVNWKGTIQLSWLKYGRDNQFTEVQHLDIFGILVEVAIEVEVTTATTKTGNDRHNTAVVAWTLQTELGKRRVSIVADSLVAHNFGQGSVDGFIG